MAQPWVQRLLKSPASILKNAQITAAPAFRASFASAVMGSDFALLFQ
jgi:hypothetical protein